MNGGLFSVLTDIPPETSEEADRWLGVTVEDDDEMTPRQRMASVPYSYRCGNGSLGNECWECPGAPYHGPVYTLFNAVGIGTDNATPIDAEGAALHVAGSLNPAFVLEQTDYRPRKWDIHISGLDGAFLIRDRPADPPPNRFIIDPDGDVGIGMTDSEIELHVTDVAYAVKGENDESEGYLGHSLPGIPTDLRVGVYDEHSPSGNYGYIGSQPYGVYGNSSSGHVGCLKGTVQFQHYVDFGAQTYDWASMPETTLTLSNPDVAAVISRLGVATETDYEPGGSKAGTKENEVQYHFRYKGAEYIFYTTGVAHQAPIIAGIRGGLPCLVASHSHVMVFYGYRDTMAPFWHVNGGNSRPRDPDAFWWNTLLDVDIYNSWPYCAPENFIYVDVNWDGTEKGYIQEPYNAFSEGLSAVPTNGHLWLKEGSYATGPITLDRDMTIRSYEGTAAIGTL